MTGVVLLTALLTASGGELLVRPQPASQGDIVVVQARGEPVSLTVGRAVPGPPGRAAADSSDTSEARSSFFRMGDTHVALIGIDAEAKAGRRRLTVRWSGRDATFDLDVKSRKFPTEKLRVEPKYVEPPADVMARITAEKAQLDGLWRRDGGERLWSQPFVRPLDELPSSAFGLQRIFNGQRRSPHNGVDFKAAAGVPIGAANAGRVALCDDLYFTGNTVVVDHGLGLYTVYAHLSEIAVAAGQPVGPGTVLGRVGATGRATGPHLHWGARLLEARVDPMQLLEIGESEWNPRTTRPSSNN